MSLEPGTSLGPYAITAKIGEGGMGQVYQATDTKLKRQVAIKILPPSLASDHDRLARFQREAEVLASLNHPNIAAIYGLEEREGVTALVMELVEGDDLSQRIARGAIPLDEALPIAHQIAEALEAAHEQGVIHRDLKPANVKVKADGTVKVLDFGLAKAMEPVGVMSPSHSMSATFTTPAMTQAGMTQAGMILGTAAYMSPEQAKGKTVDKRSDVWAFGAVLYEMLTGKRAFAGDDVADTLATVLKSEPEWDAFPLNTPPSVRRVVQACLQKSAKQRVHDVADIRLAMEGAFETGTSAPTPSPSGRRSTASWVAAAVAIALLGGLVGSRLTRPDTAPELHTTRFELLGSLDSEFNIGSSTLGLALSPDGRTVVFVGSGPNGRQLYRRSLGDLRSVAIGSLDGWFPFFSPDGEWVGYTDPVQMQGRALKKIRLDGSGNPFTVAVVPAGGMPIASWGVNDMIVFGSREESGQPGVWLVPSNGGEPELVRTAESLDAEPPRFLDVLPDGLVALATAGSAPDSEIVLVDLATGEQEPLLPGTSPRYVSTGHLVYWREGSLWAVPFDSARRRVAGSPVQVVENVQVNPAAGDWAAFAVGGNSLAYWYSRNTNNLRLFWLDRSGHQDIPAIEPSGFSGLTLSPEARRAAVVVGGDVLVYDLDRGTPTQLTVDAASDTNPVWSPDGQRVAFASDRDGFFNIFVKAANGVGEVKQLTSGDTHKFPADWSPDGEVLLFSEVRPGVRGTEIDIGRVSVNDPNAVDSLVQTEFSEWAPKFSTEGNWIAYASDESGESEVYVRPFPNVDDDKVTISRGGGTQPLWSRDGRELSYWGPNGIVTVPFTIEATFLPGNSDTPLNNPGLFGIARTDLTYGRAPDGRFLVLQGSEGDNADTALIVVENWFEELKRLVPVD